MRETKNEKRGSGKKAGAVRLIKAALSFFLLFPALLSSASVTVRTGEIRLNYTGQASGGGYYSEKDEPLRNVSLVRGGINNLRIAGDIVTNGIWFDATLNADFNDPELVEFRYNRLLMNVYGNEFFFGSLPLGFSSMVNNTNNIFGILWRSPLLPENALGAGVFGAGLKSGFGSPYYPAYLYGLSLSSDIGKSRLALFYMRITEQEQAYRYNSILQSGFAPSRGAVNRLTAKNSKGTVRKSVSLDLDREAFLEISVADSGDRNIAWELEADDGNGRFSLQYITKQSGVFRYDIRSPTGWSGLKTVTLYLSFYNSPDDLSDNSIYVDYIKLTDSSGVLYDFEDFSEWIIPDDVKVDVLTKEEAVSSLPRAYFPYQAQFYGLAFRKEKGDTRGFLELGVNRTELSPVLTRNGYYVKGNVNRSQGGLALSLDAVKISRDFDISPVSVINEPDHDLKEDDRFFLGPTTFFGNWEQEYVEVAALPEGIRLIGEGGQITRTFDVDLDVYPVFTIKVGGKADRDFEWALFAEDGASSFQLDYSSLTGIFTYDIRQATGWKGRKSFRIRIKKGKGDLILYWAKFWRTGVSRQYGLGAGSQIISGSAAYRAADDLGVSATLKVWDSRFTSYRVSLSGVHDIYKNKEDLFQLKLGLSKNRGDELEDTSDIPRFFEYFGAGAALSGRWKRKRFEIPVSSLSYEADFHGRQNAALTRGDLRVRYLAGVWFAYGLMARTGRIIHEPLSDHKHEFSMEKEFEAWLDSRLLLRYVLTKYMNAHEREWEYLANAFEVTLRKQAARFQNALNFTYRIGEFGRTARYRYDVFIMKLETKISI